MFNLCVSYELRCLKGRRKSRFDSNGRGGRGKGRTRTSLSKKGGGKKRRGDLLLDLDRPGKVARIRNEQDLLATGDVETFQRLEQIQRMNRLLKNDPAMLFTQQDNYMAGASPVHVAKPSYLAQAAPAQYLMEPLDTRSPTKRRSPLGGRSPVGARSPEGEKSPVGAKSPTGTRSPFRRRSGERLARRVVHHEVFKGEFLPGDERLLLQPVARNG